VRAGNGGNGRVAFRRELGAPKGGPNGGDGGNGGNVVVVAEEGMSTLYDYRGTPLWTAKPGDMGGQKQCHGLAGEDLVIRLPAGTLIYNNRSDELIHDLKPGETIVLAKGGRGGFGNEHFKSSVNQTPRKASPGEPGEEIEVRLELKLIAEVGLVGMPNAGKSTLLAALTRANPKIAAYPFTTLAPQLGIAEIDSTRRVVIADIPGLIEGAADGAGLGHDFLRHVERTRVLVHLLDVMPPDESDPADNYRTIRAELAQYSAKLAEKPEIIALNKMDLISEEPDRKKAVKKLCKDLGLREKDVIAISGAGRMNLKPLLEMVWIQLHPDNHVPAGWKKAAVAE
jgi:GTP-binding protein